MAPTSVLDTHGLIWFLTDDPRLGPDAASALSQFDARLILPATALAEACWLVERGRTSIASIGVLLAALDADPRIVVFPLDRAVIERSTQITSINEMHDRHIVATALVLVDRGEQVSILTRDQNITDAALVPVVW
jgi:PIN domain nuclease of toxin-antitoxin system